MKTLIDCAAFALMTMAFSLPRMAAGAAPENLESGIEGPVGSNANWAGYSQVSLIPGAGLLPITSTKTTFYLGFTGGSRADIKNMVLYTTARGKTKITAVTPVTLGDVSDPEIDLASASVCPGGTISTANPCIVRLDPTNITLSALNDYYLVVYFTSGDSHNESISVTVPTLGQTSLRGAYQAVDDSRLEVGGSIPSLGYGNPPDLLMYVMTD
jgi:hypothetical protein